MSAPSCHTDEQVKRRVEGSRRSFPNLYGLEMELETSWGQGSDEIPGASWSRRGFGILGNWPTTGISGPAFWLGVEVLSCVKCGALEGVVGYMKTSTGIQLLSLGKSLGLMPM